MEDAMTEQTLTQRLPLRLMAFSCLLFAAGLSYAQTPVDDDGNPIGTVYSDDAAAEALSADALAALVGPIALYPDDLLAVVLPASTYPLEIVQAARFLDELENDSSLQPDEGWDDSVVALLNYPEVVRMMNDDLDWTWRLGEAVVTQQSDVVAAVEAFRDRAYAAGNLKTDDRQTVTRSGTTIEIEPVTEDVIYVPYYEPEVVVVRQTTPAYHYYPRAYPVYYYPYPAGYRFNSGLFWGVTTAFQIGWSNHYLHVQHYSYLGHPYYGRSYYDRYYWRRPSIQVFNTYYGRSSRSNSGYRNQHGDHWRPRHRGGARPGHYDTRARYYSDRRRSSSNDGYASRHQSVPQNTAQRRSNTQSTRRDAATRTANRQADAVERRRTSSADSRRRSNDNAIRFRSRTTADNARIRSASAANVRQPTASTPARTAITQRNSADRRGNPAAGNVTRRNNNTGATQRRTEQQRNAVRSVERQSSRTTPGTSARARPDNQPAVTRRSTPRPTATSRSRAQVPAQSAPTRRAANSTPSRRPQAQPERRSQPQRSNSNKPARSNSRSRSERTNRSGNQRRERQ